MFPTIKEIKEWYQAGYWTEKDLKDLLAGNILSQREYEEILKSGES